MRRFKQSREPRPIHFHRCKEKGCRPSRRSGRGYRRGRSRHSAGCRRKYRGWRESGARCGDVSRRVSRAAMADNSSGAVFRKRNAIAQHHDKSPKSWKYWLPGSPLTGQEPGKPDLPVGIVDVGVDQTDRLPGAERQPAASAPGRSRTAGSARAARGRDRVRAYRAGAATRSRAAAGPRAPPAGRGRCRRRSRGSRPRPSRAARTRAAGRRPGPGGPRGDELLTPARQVEDDLGAPVVNDQLRTH